MNELSSTTRGLLESARAGLSPDTDARARVHAAVLVRVGVAVAAGTTLTAGTTTATAAKLGSGAVVKLLLSVAIAGGVGTAGYVAATRGERATPAPVPVLAAPAPHREAPPVAAAEPAVAPAVRVEAAAADSEPVPVRLRAAAAAAPATTLPQQLAALHAANRALKRGDATAALAAVDDYEARYPRGDLRPEIAAIRIDALCALERPAEAEQWSERFLARWADSPLAERVRASCARGGAR